MKITKEAKAMLRDFMAAHDSDCLKATHQQSCCGTSLVLNFAKATDDDQPTSIDGVPVLMDDDAKKRSETVTISVENGELAIRDEAASGCCS